MAAPHTSSVSVSDPASVFVSRIGIRIGIRIRIRIPYP